MIEKRWKEMWEAIKTQVKNEVHIKRILILFVLVCGVLAVLLFSMLTGAYDSVAVKTAPKEEQYIPLELYEKQQNLSELYGDYYSEVCKRDKELAYLFLKKRSLSKNVRYSFYTIKKKENYWSAAKKHGVNIDTIVGANPEMNSLNAYDGKEVIVPARRGVIHEVRENGEKVEVLAEIYRTDKKIITGENKIPWYGLRKGDLLFIPGAKPVFLSEGLQAMYDQRKLFRSPISGTYTSLFGIRIHPVTSEKKFHGAVDIRAKIGTWVGAAADGKVIDTGYNNMIGNYVKIAHANGYTSLYGHLSKIYTHVGAKVKAGKLIAKTGNTGRTTGPHLHFGIYKNGKAVNPMKYIW